MCTLILNSRIISLIVALNICITFNQVFLTKIIQKTLYLYRKYNHKVNRNFLNIDWLALKIYFLLFERVYSSWFWESSFLQLRNLKMSIYILSYLNILSSLHRSNFPTPKFSVHFIIQLYISGKLVEWPIKNWLYLVF